MLSATDANAITDDRGTTIHEYDVRDRLIRITNPDGTIVEYSYDAVGNKTELVTAHQAISYGYDALNRLRTVNDVNGQTGYSYDAVGNRETETKANGTRTTYAYDERNRLIRMEQQDASFNVIQGISYTLYDDGMRAQIAEDAGRVTDYTYDILKRLEVEQVTDAALGNRTSVWTYDATGNRLTQDVNGEITTYAYNANDQLTQETTGLDVTTYQYDANGSTVLKRLNGTETARYSYDSRNRMIGSMTNGIDSTYVYDHAGIRREKVEGNVSTTFLVDPTQAYTQVIEELDHQGRVQVSYTFGDDLISQQRFDELGAFESSFYHYDGLGSTRLLTDSVGATLNEYVYEAFGEIEHQTGTTENLYLFTGEQYDPNLGFYYLRARYYNPANGRFHTLDTYMGNNADPVTLHKYLYANADPVGMIDPSGHMSLSSIGTAQNIMGRTLAVAFSVANTFHKINASLGMINALLEAFNLLSNPGALLDFSTYLDASNPDFDDILSDEKLGEGFRVLKRNASKIARRVSTLKLQAFRNFLPRKESTFWFYLPTPARKPGNTKVIATPIRIPVPIFGSKKLNVVVGGHATRFFGVGFGLGKRLGTQEQLFRMGNLPIYN